MDVIQAEKAKRLLDAIKEFEEILNMIDSKNGATINFLLYWKVDGISPTTRQIPHSMNQAFYNSIEHQLRSLKKELRDL